MFEPPADAADRRAASPLVCYEVDQLPPNNLEFYRQARAGASRVLVSLWYVNDKATARLMRRFYREILEQGKTAPREG